jgi:integrase
MLPEGKGAVVPVQSGTFDTLFRRARTATGLLGIRFHDSRREATSKYAETLGVLELSAVTGHADINLLRRTYYRPDMVKLAAKLG